MNPHDRRCVGAPPLSPCIKVCRVDEASQLCTGCLRTLPEIASWWSLSDDEKRAVLADLPNRSTRRDVAGGSGAVP